MLEVDDDLPSLIVSQVVTRNSGQRNRCGIDM